MDTDTIINFLFENMKKLFFPEEWIDFDLKFSKSELFTLFLLERRNEITMTELAEYINTPMSTTTGIVDRLVKGGYIKRDRSESDRRIVVLKLIDKGSALLEQLKSFIIKYFEMATSDFSSEEKKYITSLILRVLHNLQKNEKDNMTQEPVNEIKKINIE